VKNNFLTKANITRKG